MHSILVVDASSRACSFVVACLHNLRHTTIAATSITEATNLMRLSPPDLVIINLAMDGATEFLSSIRGDSSGLPVIGLSDPISPQVWQQAGEVGVRHFLPKEGLPVGQLQARVTEYLREAARTPQYQRGAA